MLLRLEFGAIELLARHADLRALQEELGVTQSKGDFLSHSLFGRLTVGFLMSCGRFSVRIGRIHKVSREIKQCALEKPSFEEKTRFPPTIPAISSVVFPPNGITWNATDVLVYGI